MQNNSIPYISTLAVATLLLVVSSCKTPELIQKERNKATPEAFFDKSADTTQVSASLLWKDYFQDEQLKALIEIALQNNQELNITLQEIEIAKNEIRIRKGEYLPSVSIGGAAGLEKVGRYTSQGANDANTDIRPGVEFPEPLQDYLIGTFATWEVDIWKKLRNAKKSAMMQYLGSVEGKNFMVTNLISEIASNYYELLALDNQLVILKQNIEIQKNALVLIRFQKDAARVTELAVRRFEAQVLQTQSLEYSIRQEIFERENKLNYIIGRFPQAISRSKTLIQAIDLSDLQSGIPSQLLANRPDIRRAELELEAAKIDVSVAKAEFYPSLRITAGLGFNAFNPAYLISTPESILYSLMGDLTAPLVNRNAIKARYLSANAKQIQAIYTYEQTVINAYIEVMNQLSSLSNLGASYDLKSKQVAALTESVSISTELFNSARADYMEVLLTQRDALESTFELIDTKRDQLIAKVNMYRALGGGWK